MRRGEGAGTAQPIIGWAVKIETNYEKSYKPTERTFFDQLKRIQALAEIGLEYGHSHYDLERYEEIQEICLNMMEQITDVPIEKIRPVIQENNGYKTPNPDDV